MNKDKSIRVVLDPEEMQAAQDAARAAGLDLQIEQRPHILPAVTLVLMGGGALLAAKFVVDLVDRLRGGIVIDARPDATELVRRNRDVPYGWALVLAADGSVSINVHDSPKDASERLIQAIIDGVFKTAEDVTKEAGKTLGGDKVKSIPV
jgi:hypothetical protein